MTLFLKYHKFHVSKQFNCKSLAFHAKMLQLPKVRIWSLDGG